MSRLATPLRGLDGETPLSVGGFHAYDATFIGRYLSNYPPKNLTYGEANYYRANKIGFFTVWEDEANAAAQGYGRGRSDAEQHLAMARQAGRKDGVGALFFAVDFDTNPTPGITDAYFDGVASVIPKAECGAYGGITEVERQMERGFGRGWQTLAWSGGAVSHSAQVYQRSIAPENGASYDFDDAFFADYGQWDYLAPVIDVNHYERYPAHPYKIFGKEYNERAWAVEFDHRFAAHKAHRDSKADWKAVVDLKHGCKLIRDRIWTVAHAALNLGEFDMPVDWTREWLGWRWQEWDHRFNVA